MPPKSKFLNLKGVKLYNALLKELGEKNKKANKKQQLGIDERRKIVSTQLYPYFKSLGKTTKAELTKKISQVVKGLPPSDVCNPLLLSESYLSAIEFYDLDNHFRSVLPQCLDVRVSAGQYGNTKIFNTSNYSYYGTGVKNITEETRKPVENNSDRAYFNGIVKVKPNRKDDKNPSSYFVDYVLYMNDTPMAEEDGADTTLTSKEKLKKERVSDYLREKFAILQKEKRKKRRKKKSEEEKKKAKEPAEVKKRANKAIDQAIAAQRMLLKNKLITKKEFEKTVSALKSKKQK